MEKITAIQASGNGKYYYHPESDGIVKASERTGAAETENGYCWLYAGVSCDKNITVDIGGNGQENDIRPVELGIIAIGA
jgi:hypothetical protein